MLLKMEGVGINLKKKLTPDEKMKLEMKKLKAGNERLKAEKRLFKKVGGNGKGAVSSRVR